ncbi:MAG: porin [Janthinobacterium lividum]
MTIVRLNAALRRTRSCGLCAALALAGAAASTSANAQSTVTLYGLIDSSIEVTNPGSGYTARLDSGAWRGSRIGIAGSEPLGNGNDLLFTLENGFSNADGTLSTAGSLFNRQAWIGARGAWGEVRFGRQYSPLYIPFKGKLDAFGAGTIASGLNNLSKITPYVSDAMTWLAPRVAGFSGTVMVALRDPAAADGNGLAGYYTTLDYQFGPFEADYARQQTHGADALRSNLGGISYRYAAWRAWLAFFNGDGGTPLYRGHGGSVSLQYQPSAALAFSVGYAHVSDDSVAAGSASQWSALVNYTMSPRLTLYGAAARLANHGASTFTLRGVNVTGLPVAYPGAPVQGVQFGLIERF